MGWLTMFIFLPCLPLLAAKNIKIGFLPAMTDKAESTINEGGTYAGAIQVAINALNNDSRYSHLNFSYVFQDTEFDTDVTLKAIVTMYFEGVDVLIGPENRCVVSAKLASSLNLPMIGFRCLDSVLSNKKEYPTFARTVPSTAKVTKSIMALLDNYKWTSFSVVKEETAEWEEVSRTLGLAAKTAGVKINTNDTFPTKFVAYQQDEQQDICKLVRDTSNKTRVYVFLGEHDQMVQFVRCLRNLTDISLYTVVHVRSYNTEFDYTESDALKKLTYSWYELLERPDPTAETVDTSFRQLITLLPKRGHDDDRYQEFTDDVRYYLGQPPFDRKSIPSLPLPISIYAAKIYDGIMLYGKALKKLLNQGGNAKDGRALMRLILNSTFESIQQFNDTIDEHGDAEGAYTTVAVVRDESDPVGWAVKQVGTFSGHGHTQTKLHYDELQPMSWLSGQSPLSEPKCGFNGELCKPGLVGPLVAVVGSSLLLVAIIMGVCSRRHYEQKRRIDSLLWKLDKSEIEMISYCEDKGFSDDEEEKDEKESQPDEPLLTWKDGSVRSVSSEGSDITLFEQGQQLASSPWKFLENGDEEKQAPELPYYCPVGYCKNMLVCLKCVWNSLELTSSSKKELHFLRELTHENVNKFIGACIEPPHTFIVSQYCERGSLEDVLIANRKLFMEESVMKFSLINDLVKGMMFIHNSAIGCHGNLKSTKCLVDSRFVLKIGGLGLHHFRKSELANGEIKAGANYFRDRLWTAPELLRGRNNGIGTQKGDVYSFGIILHEILGLLGPWGDTRLSDRDIVVKVQQGRAPHTRPNLAVVSCEEYLTKCMEESWSESPELRPDFKTLHQRSLTPLRNTIGSNILESMLERIETYSKNLEGLVEDRTDQLRTEKRRTEKLLHRMLPKSVAEDLMKGKEVQASYYECVTVYFSDIVGFTKLCSESDPYQIVKFLNDLYTRFDEITNHYDVYKVETIGDAYMVVSGLPKLNGDNHAGEIASMSLHLLSALKKFKIHHQPGVSLQLRIGIHSGPVAVGVVGIKMPRYCLFGDTVNTTSRMESNGEPLRVHCSDPCKNILEKLGGYYVEERGLIEMKGKGKVLTHWVQGEDSFHRIKRLSEAQGPYGAESACNSTRSSFNDNLHLMPNGFRRPKLTRDQFSSEDFRLKPFAAVTRKSLRRGSMPINDFKRGSVGLSILEVNNRRGSCYVEVTDVGAGLSVDGDGSTPLNQRRTFEVRQGWELKEDDERRPCLDMNPVSVDPKAIRISPEGCDSEPEVDSRRSSKRNFEPKNVIKPAASTAGQPLDHTSQPCPPEHCADTNDPVLRLPEHYVDTNGHAPQEWEQVKIVGAGESRQQTPTQIKFFL